MRNYNEITGNIVTLEYILLSRVNDRKKDADLLSEFSLKLNSKINLIPYNPNPDINLKPSSRERINTVQRMLKENGSTVTLRRSRGKDIAGACGQLSALTDKHC